jgi:hypothetical protein
MTHASALRCCFRIQSQLRGQMLSGLVDAVGYRRVDLRITLVLVPRQLRLWEKDRDTHTGRLAGEYG